MAHGSRFAVMAAVSACVHAMAVAAIVFAFAHGWARPTAVPDSAMTLLFATPMPAVGSAARPPQITERPVPDDPAREPPIATPQPVPKVQPRIVASTVVSRPRMQQPSTTHREAASPAPTNANANAIAVSNSTVSRPIEATPSLTPGWNAMIAAWLAAHKIYPEAARQDDVEGVVKVRFTVAAGGQVTAVDIIQSSGSPILDNATRAWLLNAHLPPPQIATSLTVPIAYRLQ